MAATDMRMRKSLVFVFMKKISDRETRRLQGEGKQLTRAIMDACAVLYAAPFALAVN
jgi:hypothetical protein